MTKKREESHEQKDEGFWGELNRLTGSGGTLDIDRLDSRVLWSAVVALAQRKANLTIGVTRDGGSWSVQLWDGKFPDKRYFRDTDELNRFLAAITRSAAGNRVSPDFEQVLQSYGV